VPGRDRRELVAIFAGGMLGALARVAVLQIGIPNASAWPWATFAVNILGEDHEELSNLFAKKGADRFSQTPWRVGVSGAPVLEDAIAYLDCRFEAEYPGGDHKIIVGRVLDLDMREGSRPLLFFKGGYERMHEA